MSLVEKQTENLAHAADALVDAASFHSIVKWLEDNGFEDLLAGDQPPLDVVIDVLNHYKDHLAAIQAVREAIVKV